MTNFIIDMQKHRTPGANCFTGRDRGKEIAAAEKLNQFDANKDALEIIVAEDVVSLNPTFLAGLLCNMPKGLDPEKFEEICNFKLILSENSRLTEDEVFQMQKNMGKKAHDAYLTLHRGPVSFA